MRVFNKLRWKRKSLTRPQHASYNDFTCTKKGSIPLYLRRECLNFLMGPPSGYNHCQGYTFALLTALFTIPPHKIRVIQRIKSVAISVRQNLPPWQYCITRKLPWAHIICQFFVDSDNIWTYHTNSNNSSAWLRASRLSSSSTLNDEALREAIDNVDNGTIIGDRRSRQEPGTSSLGTEILRSTFHPER